MRSIIRNRKAICLRETTMETSDQESDFYSDGEDEMRSSQERELPTSTRNRMDSVGQAYLEFCLEKRVDVKTLSSLVK